MDRKTNLFLAKRRLVDSVYLSARLEGVNVTFPQTQTIIDGAIVNNVPVDEIQKVLNLKSAWSYVLNHIDEALTISYICKVNDHVSRNESLEEGVLRNGQIGVSGTEYRPPIPTIDSVQTILDEIKLIRSPEEKAIEYFCRGVRSQIFWDGNKRTSTLVANKILIEGGAGILQIHQDLAEEFNKSLKHYYDTNDSMPLKSTLHKCIINRL